MGQHNYKLKVERDPIAKLDKDTFMPFYRTNIALDILSDAQHDGHGWQRGWAESELVLMIMEDLGKQVEKIVEEADPFVGHYFDDHKEEVALLNTKIKKLEEELQMAQNQLKIYEDKI